MTGPGKVGAYSQYVVYERRRVYMQYVVFYKCDRPVPQLPRVPRRPSAAASRRRSGRSNQQRRHDDDQHTSDEGSGGDDDDDDDDDSSCGRREHATDTDDSGDQLPCLSSLNIVHDDDLSLDDSNMSVTQLPAHGQQLINHAFMIVTGL